MMPELAVQPPPGCIQHPMAQAGKAVTRSTNWEVVTYDKQALAWLFIWWTPLLLGESHVAVFQDSTEPYLPLALKYRRKTCAIAQRIALDILPLKFQAQDAFSGRDRQRRSHL